MAEWAYAHGWHSADVVTDKLLVYFQNVCTAFTDRFQQLGGKIVDSESFTQGDKTIGNVATRINGKPANMIAFCTSFAGDQPAFVDALRSEGNKTPIMNSWAGDGAYWWSKNPKVTNFYFVTYAAADAKDPDAAVRAFEAKMKAAGTPAQTGGFITGADAIDAIAYAIKQNGGSTDGAKLAATLSHLTNFKTLGGPISFTPTLPQPDRASVPRDRGEQQRRQGHRGAHDAEDPEHPLIGLAVIADETRRGPGSLRALGVSRSFAGVQALEDVDLELEPGEIVGLIGPNGAGKTTLVNLLTGFDLPTSGRIELGGVEITRWPPHRRGRAGLARTFQHGRLFRGLSVRENVEVAALGVGVGPGGGAPARVRAARAARARARGPRRARRCCRTATSASSASHGRSRCGRGSC